MISIVMNIFLIVCLLLLCVTGDQTIPISIINNVKTFRLRSRVVDLDADFETTIDESYSSEQKRGILNFRLKHHGDNIELPAYNPGVFFVDAHERFSLLMDSKQVNCIIMKPDAFLKQIGIGSRDTLWSEVYGAPDYVVGPAKLLYLIEENRHLLRPGTSSDDSSHETIRNVACTRYELAFPNRDDWTLGVWFSDEHLQSHRDKILPLEVDFLSNDRISTVVYFTPIEKIDEFQDTQSTHSARQDPSGLEIINDKFMLNPLSSCVGNSMKFEMAVDLFATKPLDEEGSKSQLTEEARISFKAEVEDLTRGRTKNIFVSYNRLPSLMRLDTQIPNFDDTVQLFNFEQNRMYHIEQKSTSNSVSSVELTSESSIKTAAGPRPCKQSRYEHNCISSLIYPDHLKGLGAKLSLGELILGSNEFVYLGQAKVRGISALVYASVGMSLPFWVDPPTPINNSSSRESSSTGDQNEHKWINIVYLADNSKPDLTAAKLVLHQLLAMEFMKIDCKAYNPGSNIVPEVLEIIKLRIFNFHWELDLPPNESQVVNLFSLVDRCSASSGFHRHHIKLELLLESTSSNFASISSDTRKRNMNFLASLSKNTISVEMVHNLQTKLVDVGKSKFVGNKLTANNNNFPNQVLLSFELAEHFEHLATPIRLGRGIYVQGIYEQGATMVKLNSLSSCYLYAAQKGVNFIFGYAAPGGVCFVSRKPTDGSTLTGDGIEHMFKLDSEGPVEIFIVGQAKNEPKLIESSRRSARLFLQRTHKTSNFLLEVGPTGENVAFRVKQTHITENNKLLSPTIDGQSNDEVEGDSSRTRVNKISGFGWSPATSKQICRQLKTSDIMHTYNLVTEEQNSEEPSEIQSETDELDKLEAPQPVTFAECEAACLSDLVCESFSVCVTGGEFVCMLSRVSLRTKPEVDRLLATAANLTRKPIASGARGRGLNNREFELELNSAESQVMQKVRVIRHPNCNIYNKKFSDLVVEVASESLVTLNRLQLYGVGDVDDCARICTYLNIKAVQAHEESVNSELDTHYRNLEQPRELYQSKNLMANRVCFGFFYTSMMRLDKVSTQDEIEKVRELTSEFEGINNLNNDGICAIGNFRPMKQSAKQINLPLREYKFKMEKLYEEQVGFSLRMPDLSNSQAKALQQVASRSTSNSESLKLAFEYLTEGNNNQVQLETYDSQCAKYCLLQTLGPWPLCKSFDVVRQQNANPICLLNSVTLKQTLARKRLDLIDTNNTNNVDRRHYEPLTHYRLPLFLDSTHSDEQSMPLNTDDEYCDAACTSKQNDKTWTMSIGGAIIVILGLVVGVWVGSTLSRQPISCTRSQPRQQSINSVTNIELPDDIVHSDLFASNGRSQGNSNYVLK